MSTRRKAAPFRRSNRSLKLGFTGTRLGMTSDQRRVCLALLDELCPIELHHGDAKGADSEIHEIAADRHIHVAIHPPKKAADRAYCAGDETRDEAAYMVRNRAIVDETDVLMATPSAGMSNAFNSGTWRTIRYAKSVGKPTFIVMPNGQLAKSNPS